MKEYALNPFLPEYEYIPDGEPHVFDGRVYLYGSHDRFDGERFCMNDYVCYSADCQDLKHWRYEGVIYDRRKDVRLKEERHELWAPDVVRGKDGRYYLYYCPDDSIRSIGVAVCDSPAGKYEFYGLVHDKEGKVIGEREGDTIAFDPGVFMDEDGTCYLYSGNGPRIVEDIGKEPKASVVMILEDDMVTVREEPKKLLPVLGVAAGTGYEGHEFFEASSIRKIRGKYYLVYSSVHLHELCYAISDRPDGGFQYGGVIVSNADIVENSEAKNSIGNNHGGIECINGKYYIFYHRQTNATMHSRQACAEEIIIDEDGKICQVPITSCGLNGGPLPDNGIYPASCVCLLYGKYPHEIAFSPDVKIKQPYVTQDHPDFDMETFTDTDKSQLPRQYIKNGQDGMHAVFRYFDIQELSQIQVVVRGTASGRLEIHTGENGKIISEIQIEPSDEWKVFSGSAEKCQGVQELHFCYHGEGILEFLEFGLKK